MKKEIIIISTTIGFVCAILVAVILVQFKTVDKTDIAGIEAAREEELQTLLSSLKTRYEEIQEKLQDTNNKIQDYKQTVETNKEASELLQKELEQTNLLVGKTNVTGEGVIVTLSDNENVEIEASDLRTLINELKLAGAEAISLNDKRILNMTEIVDVGGRILINEERVVSPYVVKAIGGQTYLSSALSLKTTGFIDNCKINGKTVEMTSEKRINIDAYNSAKKIMKFKYAKEVVEE